MFQEPADKKQIKEQILDSIQSFQEWISDCPRQSLPGYGERLMSVRKDSGLKQAEFADRTGVSVVQLSRMAVSYTHLLEDESEYKKMSLASNPYGDGHASERIAGILEEWLLNK